MADLNVNSIGDASGGNTTTINGYTPTMSNMAGRNRIINGDMRIDQRNAGAAVTTGSAFPVDRFLVSFSNDGAFSAQQDSSAPAGFVNSLKFTTTTADSSLSTSQFALIRHSIEGLNVSDFAWGTASAKSITLSFWVRSSLTGTFSGSLTNSSVNRSYIFDYAISAADTWEYKTVTVPGDTSGTWLTTNGVGIRLDFSMGAGDTFQGTSGSWTSTNDRTTAASVSVIGTLNATWYITGVQLEAGSVATPFEHRPYGQELALCQRYYWQQARGSANLMLGIGTVFNGTNMNGFVQFPVTMRTGPSLVQTTGSSFYIFERDVSAVLFTGFTALTRVSKDAGQLYISGLSGTNGQAGILFTNNASAAVGYSAEL